MIGLLYDFWYGLLANFSASQSLELGFDDFNGHLFDNNVTLLGYLSLLLSFISLIIIVWLCCSFIVKIVKLVGGLIR